jgi:hypothetical protein
MDVKVKVELNAANIAKLQEAAKKAFPLVMDALKTEVELAQVIPRDTGELMESSGLQVTGTTGYLTYGSLYARKLYFHPEYNFRKDKHINAQGRWLDDWIFGSRKQWLPDTFLKFWKENSGGVIK